MRRPSPDYNVGDLALLRNSAFHPEYDGALAEIAAPEKLRVSLAPDERERPVEALYKVRLVLSVGDEDPAIFLAARYQLQPIDLGDPPWSVPQLRFRPARVSRSDPDTGGAGRAPACTGTPRRERLRQDRVVRRRLGGVPG